jgi:4-amino-4-deoxy-L-arabinose transferase-like glycosyltransferase
VLTCCAVWLAYVLVRVVTIPQAPLTAGGFCHDCAYLEDVAQNLRAGKGYVEDGLWLVYLQPDRLPMPYHNGGPLFPTVVAGVMAMFGVSGLKAGFLVAALASPGLIAAFFFLVSRFVPNVAAAFTISFLCALIPSIWEMSWMSLTDELWLALMIACLGALVRIESWSMAVWAGAFFGLAWLTRIAALSVLPGIGLWLLLTLGWRKGLRRGIVIGFVAAVVISPWLIHTARVWGDPLRSDTPTITNSHVRSWDLPDREVYLKGGGGEASLVWPHREVYRVWHMPDPPAAASEVFRRDPVRYLEHWAKGVPATVRELIRSTADSNYLAAALLALLALVAARWQRLSPSNPYLLSAVLYTVVFVLFVAVGGAAGTEGRYFILVHALLALWLAISVHGMTSAWRKERRGVPLMSALCLAALYIAVGLVPSDLRMMRVLRATDPYLLRYTQAARLTDERIAHGEPVIVGNHPYIYAVATGAQALAIPEADDNYLKSFMEKYRARTILLSGEERAYWRPGWQTDAGIPQWLHPLGEVNGYWLYRKESPASRDAGASAARFLARDMRALPGGGRPAIR